MMNDIWVIPYTFIVVVMGYDLGCQIGETIKAFKKFKKKKPLPKVEEPKDEYDEYLSGIDFRNKEIYDTIREYSKFKRETLAEDMKKFKSYIDGKEK